MLTEVVENSEERLARGTKGQVFVRKESGIS